MQETGVGIASGTRMSSPSVRSPLSVGYMTRGTRILRFQPARFCSRRSSTLCNPPLTGLPRLPIGAFAFKGLLLVTVSVVAFGFVVRGLGVAIALPLLIIVSAYGSTRFRWRPTLIMAAGLTIFCVLVFVKGLGIPLPIIGPWFGG